MKHFWSRLYGLFRLRIQLWKEDLFGQAPPTNQQEIEHKPSVTMYARTEDRKGWTKKRIK